MLYLVRFTVDKQISCNREVWLRGPPSLTPFAGSVAAILAFPLYTISQFPSPSPIFPF